MTLGAVCYSSSDFTLANTLDIPHNINLSLPQGGAKVFCQTEAVPMQPTKGLLASLTYWKTNEPFS